MMTLRHARTATALGLVLAGCAAPTHSAPAPALALSDLPAVYQPVQVASNQGPQYDIPQPMTGKVVITRSQAAVPPPTPEEVARTVAEQVKRQTIADIDARFNTLANRTDTLLSQTSEVLRANNGTQQAVNQQLSAQRDIVGLTREQTQTQLAALANQVSGTRAQLAAQRQTILQPQQVAAIAARQVQQAEPRIQAIAAQTVSSAMPQMAAIAQQAVSASQPGIATLVDERVADSAPQMRALALQSVKDSEGYIRTIARTAVKDSDPDMQKALAEAATTAVKKDDRIVFAIRKVVNDQLAQQAKAQATAQQDVNIASAGLEVAQPLPPGVIPSDKQLANIAPASGPLPGSANLTTARTHTDWVDIRQYRVVVHEDSKTLEDIMTMVVKRAEPFIGPWRLKWKISPENQDILTQRFSLDVETSFQQFVNYLAQYLVNERGIKITFSLFDNDRIIVISD
ncbi:MAG: hypothetical protein GC129_01545 [Proteobacteria bacterium]|nr:hypothetical protein [Pseudomonadota bacterium]